MPRKETVKPKIIHEMADGTILDSIEGIVIPLTPETYPLYKELADMTMKNRMLAQRREAIA